MSLKTILEELIGEDGQVTGYSKSGGRASVDLTESYHNELRKKQRAKIPETLAKIEGMIPEKKDERLNKTSGGQFSPPQFVDIEARGYNQAIEDFKANMKGKS